MSNVQSENRRDRSYYETDKVGSYEVENDANPYHAILNAFGEYDQPVLSTTQIAGYANMHISTAASFLREMDEADILDKHNCGSYVWTVNGGVFIPHDEERIRYKADRLGEKL